MGKKIKDYIYRHPVRIIIILGVCLLSLISTISLWKPVLVNSFVITIFVIILIYASIKTYKGHKKE